MKIVVVFVVLICMTSCYQSTRNCSDFKTGNFKSEVLINNKTYISTFKRTETLQIETYNEKIDSSEEIFHGYSTTSTEPTTPTDLTQGAESTFTYEMEWSSTIKDSTYNHTDGT